MRKHLALLLLPCLSLAFAPAPLPRPDTAKDDLKKMQGKWLRVSCTGGSFPPVARPLNDIALIDGSRITYDFGKGGAPWDLKLGTGKSPRAFDISQEERKGRGGGRWSGLYELDGDNLRVCFTPGLVRPRSIQPSKAGEFLQTFKRLKP
jgi:uncharacterized protein (TIGR03067 family)